MADQVQPLDLALLDIKIEAHGVVTNPPASDADHGDEKD